MTAAAGLGATELRSLISDLPYPDADGPRAMDVCPLSEQRDAGARAARRRASSYNGDRHRARGAPPRRCAPTWRASTASSTPSTARRPSSSHRGAAGCSPLGPCCVVGRLGGPQLDDRAERPVRGFLVNARFTAESLSRRRRASAAPGSSPTTVRRSPSSILSVAWTSRFDTSTGNASIDDLAEGHAMERSRRLPGGD